MFKEEEIPLSKKEYDLLVYMMENNGIVLTREKLIEKVWDMTIMATPMLQMFISGI